MLDAGAETARSAETSALGAGPGRWLWPRRPIQLGQNTRLRASEIKAVPPGDLRLQELRTAGLEPYLRVFAF